MAQSLNGHLSTTVMSLAWQSLLIAFNSLCGHIGPIIHLWHGPLTQKL